MNIIIFYLVGIVIWFLFLAIMPSKDNVSTTLLYSQIFLTLGFFIGIFGNKLLLKHRWMAIFIPLMSLVIGLFGIMR